MQIAISGSFALLVLAVNIMLQSRIIAIPDNKKSLFGRRLLHLAVLLIFVVIILLGIGYTLVNDPIQYEAMAIILSILAMSFIFQNITLTKPHTDSLARSFKQWSYITLTIGAALLLATLLVIYI